MQQARTIPELDSWTTITLGEYQRSRDYVRAIKARNRDITDWAMGLLPRVTCSRERKTITLVKVPVGYFGFSTRACCGAIYTQAAALGLYLCPAEVGPALMLQYPDEQVPRYLLIGMEAIADPVQPEPVSEVLGSRRSIMSLFRIERLCGSRFQLHCAQGSYDTSYSADAYFVFARR